MKKLMIRLAKHAIAGVLLIGVSSTALAQQAPIKLPESIPPVPQGVQLPLPTPSPLNSSSSSPYGSLQPSGPAPIRPGTPSEQLIQTPAPKEPPPVISSQPSPFNVAPETPAPATGDDQHSFPGNKPVQDLSQLLAGKFENTKYKWYGFVRLDAIYDFRPIRSTDDFVTSSIPVPQGRGQNFVMTPRYTRFGFDTETPIESLDWTIKTRIEMDFFNGNTSGAFGSFPLRLRFAWADFGPFLIGQAASLFMDYDVFPNVLDYEGPGGMVLVRQPIAAIRIPIGEKIKLALGVEQPYSDIQWFENGAFVVNPGTGIIGTPGVGRNVQDVPDFTSNIRYVGDYGHVQVAGVLRKLTFQPATGTSAFDELGYGINVTGTFHPWALLLCTPRSGDESTPLSRTRLLWQFAAGRGINRYIQDVNGLGLDATFDPINGFRALPSYGWFVAYEQWWAQRWASNFTFGQDYVSLTNTLPGDTYHRANYVSANIIWLPLPRMGVGLEYLYGFRQNKDGQLGFDHRIQTGFQYRF
jgi:hypothetical protein